jgi:steroid Delta-isomerase
MKGTEPVSPPRRSQVASGGMPSQEAIAHTVNRYLELVAKGATDDILTLYAAGATIEDPIGADLRRGHDAIREFYAGFQDAKKDTELAELRVGANEAAFLWHLTLDAGDSRTRISPISTMAFDEDAKITSMRAFWSPSDVKVV